MRNVLLATALITGFMVTASTAEALGRTWGFVGVDGGTRFYTVGETKAVSPRFMLGTTDDFGLVQTHLYAPHIMLDKALVHKKSHAMMNPESSNVKADRELGILR